MRQVIAILILMQCAAITFLNCSGSSGPSTPGEYIMQPEPGPDDTLSVPAGWGEYNCGVAATVPAGHVTGRAASAGYVWPGLLENGVLVAYGEGKPVGTGSLSLTGLYVPIQRSQALSGEYQLVAYLSDDVDDVGQPELRRTESPQFAVTLNQSTSAFDQCVTLMQGDSVYLTIDDEGLFETTHTYPGSYYRFEIRRQKDSTLDTTHIKLLPIASGIEIIYPLKVSYADTASECSWFVQAFNGSYLVEEAELMVERPRFLGLIYNDFDDTITYWASQYAIPVALLKAQVDKESEVDYRAYRYEPCNVDLSQLEDSMIGKEPYNHYNLQIPAGWPNGPLARGDRLAEADTVRAVQLYGGTSFIDKYPTDGFMTAGEYIVALPAQNWGNCTSGGDWIAQTTVAASYGLMQIVYTTAVFPVRWNAGRGGNPSYLFSTNVNLQLGARYLRKCFDKDTASTWMARWRNALARYNKGYSAKADSLFTSYPYADDILSRISYYAPRR